MTTNIEKLNPNHDTSPNSPPLNFETNYDSSTKDLKNISNITANAFRILSKEELSKINDINQREQYARANLDAILQEFASQLKNPSDYIQNILNGRNEAFFQVYKSWDYDDILIKQFLQNYINANRGPQEILEIIPATAVVSAIDKQDRIDFYNKNNQEALKNDIKNNCIYLGVDEQELNNLLEKYKTLFIPVRNEPTTNTSTYPNNNDTYQIYKFYLEFNALLDKTLQNNIKNNQIKGSPSMSIATLKTTYLNNLINQIGYYKSGHRTDDYYKTIQNMEGEKVK